MNLLIKKFGVFGIMKHKFNKNDRYYSISVYAFFTIILAALGIKLIMSIPEVKSFLGNLISAVSSFLLGFFIAYLINPLAKFISTKVLKKIFRIKSVKIRKVFSILFAYIIVFGVIITVMFYIIPQVVETLSQISDFIKTAQTGYNKVLNEIQSIDDRYKEFDLGPVYDFVSNIPGIVSTFITDKLPEILPTVFSTSVSVISGVIDFFIALIVSVYMLIDKPKLINNAKKITYAIFGIEKGDRFINTASECNEIFGDFIIGKMIDSIIIGFLCFIIMTAFKLPYALVISVIVGITNMIPYFGPFIGAVPGVLLLIIVDFKYALIFAVLILCLQQFDGLYLGPRILGESTGLRPIWIIFAITVGGWLAGVTGMFLGVPVVAVIAFLLDRSISRKIIERDIVFEVDEETGIMQRVGMIIDETEYDKSIIVDSDNLDEIDSFTDDNDIDDVKRNNESQI